jgi:hypothetical protein
MSQSRDEMSQLGDVVAYIGDAVHQLAKATVGDTRLQCSSSSGEIP